MEPCAVTELGTECHPASLSASVSWRDRGAEHDHPAAWTKPEYDAHKASEMKAQGNAHYSAKQFDDAIRCYTEALELTRPDDEEFSYSIAVFYSNRAACHLQLQSWEDAVEDCSAALDKSPRYVKALMRRATALEALDRLEDALQDYHAVLEIDPTVQLARKKHAQLETTVKERQEKMKAEMLDKLKGFGNSILGKFGMSTDNFKMVQDPKTGGYNISFQQ